MSSGTEAAGRAEGLPFSCHLCGRRSVVMRGHGPGEVPADLSRCSLCGRWACPDHYTGFICDGAVQAQQAQAARWPRLGCRGRVLGAGAHLSVLCLALARERGSGRRAVTLR